MKSTYAPVDFMVCIANNLSTENISKATLSALCLVLLCSMLSALSVPCSYG